MKRLALAIVTAIASTTIASASVYEEHFNTDTGANPVTNIYPQYVLSGPGGSDVFSQQLRLSMNTGQPEALVTTQVFGSAISDIHVELKLDTGAAPGNYSIGVFLGLNTPTTTPTANDNAIEFFPGYAPIPGALRVQGTGGFAPVDVGFVPAMGVMHSLDIHTDGTGLFTVKLTDGSNPSNTYSANWTNPSLTNGYHIGFWLQGGTAQTGIGTYDNLIVVPEPSAGFLLTTALAFLWFKTRIG